MNDCASDVTWQTNQMRPPTDKSRIVAWQGACQPCLDLETTRQWLHAKYTLLMTDYLSRKQADYVKRIISCSTLNWNKRKKRVLFILYEKKNLFFITAEFILQKKKIYISQKKNLLSRKLVVKKSIFFFTKITKYLLLFNLFFTLL